jgi:large subunit ribosomal protein L29
MDIDEVRALSDAELAAELGAAKRNLYDLRFQLATRQLNDYTQIRKTRKHIARLMMVQAERQAALTVTEAGR